MKALKKKNEDGFSLIQVIVAFGLLSGAGVLGMKYFSKQQTQIKQQSSDISVNYILHNVSKVISARSVCTHSYRLANDKMPMEEDYELQQIAMQVAGQPDLVIAKVETEETARLVGKFGAWVSKITVVNHDPPLSVKAKLRKARLAIDFQRRITADNVKTDKTFLDINLVENTEGVVESCFGSEDFSAKAFCETSLQGVFNTDTQLCSSIQITSYEPTTPPVNGVYSLRTSRDPAFPDLHSDIRIDGDAKISNWIDKNGDKKQITFSNGDISNVRQIVAEKEIVAAEVTAKRFNHSSDRRLKKNITQISTAQANDILKLNGVSFEWKKSNEKALGFIAQDVEKVYPNLVTENEYSHSKTVDYAGILPLILEKMKAQEKEIQELNKRISKLKEQKK